MVASMGPSAVTPSRSVATHSCTSPRVHHAPYELRRPCGHRRLCGTCRRRYYPPRNFQPRLRARINCLVGPLAAASAAQAVAIAAVRNSKGMVHMSAVPTPATTHARDAEPGVLSGATLPHSGGCPKGETNNISNDPNKKTKTKKCNRESPMEGWGESTNEKHGKAHLGQTAPRIYAKG